MLSYTSEVLAARLAGYGEAVWPAQLVALAAAAGLLVLLFRPGMRSGRAIAAILAAAWLWTGAVYFLLHLAAIDFTAPAQGGLFLLQGLLIAWTGVLRGGLAPRLANDAAGRFGLALVLLGLLLYPALAGLAAGDWRAAPLFGLVPAPTRLATLGLLLLAERTPRHLLALPLLWSLVAGWLAWELAQPWDLVLPLAGLGALWLARRRPRSEP